VIAPCDAFAEELVAYLDGEQPEAERARIEAHIGTCLSCRREIERLRRLHVLLGELRPIEPSAGFEEALWRHLDPPAPRATRQRRAIVWAAPALAAAAVLALVWYSSLAPMRTTGAPVPRAVAAAPRPATAPAEAVARREAEPESAPRDLAANDLDQYPPELVEHPELFLRLPVVRHLHKLEHFEEVRQHGGGEPPAG
jgi:anti-sigma factor RsiW